MSSHAQDMTGPVSYWPHLLGKPVAEAERLIKLERPELTVVIIPHNTSVTREMRDDRVRLFSDKRGNIVKCPRVC